MNEFERETAHEYLQRWKRVGPALEAIRRRELRAYDWAKNRSIVASLFEIGVQRAVPRKSCGFIEWNRRLGVVER